MSERDVRVVKKVLSANDVGETNAHQAGIVIPKNAEVLRFFPTLDSRVKNPRATVSVKDPLTGTYWSLEFIYYNGKVVGDGTRNEYRLTRMTGMFRELGAKRGDTLVFRKSTSGEVLVSLEPIDRSEVGSQTGSTSEVLRGGWRIVSVEEE